ncbi:diguanylate cyclase domain-containing protein [Castellaniella sp.]|uniref:sensor domain-containing diguanylate cyclase n=1 Tax=Castellaniella sp. TaxID=1955812 RepID=UPI0035636FEA
MASALFSHANGELRGLELNHLFDVMPMSLWLEDYSALYVLFEQWRQDGVQDLAAWLAEDDSRLTACAASMRIVRVNRQTLALYGAQSSEELMARLGEVVRDDTMAGFAAELVQLWQGIGAFHSVSVNYTLDGGRLDISLKGVVLPDRERPWDQVLVMVEDVTELQDARRLAQANERFARELFSQAPVSLWVEDFSQIKVLLDEVRAQGISDFRTFLDVHPEFVRRCQAEIRVLDVNDYTLKMFRARSQPELLGRLSDVFHDEMHESFAEQLNDLWHGRLYQQREVQNRNLNGDILYIHMQLSVFDGHEDSWSMVLVALTDITARKKAEAYLEYLGQHDVLTKLKNRMFYTDEIDRLLRKRVKPISCISLDLNNLKESNDLGGHAVGDGLLRRMGEVLSKAVDPPASVSRIGGDEFMVLLPGVDRAGALAVVDDIHRLLELNNQFYGGVPLSVSVGVASADTHEVLEKALHLADLEMYRNKRLYHAYRQSGAT